MGTYNARPATKWRKAKHLAYELHPILEQWIGKKIIGQLTHKSLRNAWKLIEYLCRKHAAPNVIGRSFALDRRALSSIPEIGLTEPQVRLSIEKLVQQGVLVRISLSGNRYQASKDGPRKAPVIFQLASDLIDLARSLRSKKSPKSILPRRGLHLGDSEKPSQVASPSEIRPDSPLERVLNRMREGIASKPVANKPPKAPDLPSSPLSAADRALRRYRDQPTTVQRRGVALDDPRLSVALARFGF